MVRKTFFHVTQACTFILPRREGRCLSNFLKKLSQGRAQELERVGGGHNLKPSVFHPKSSEEQKRKGHHALRLSFIRILPLHHKSLVHLSAGEGSAAAVPPWIRPCVKLLIPIAFFQHQLLVAIEALSKIVNARKSSDDTSLLIFSKQGISLNFGTTANYLGTID